MCRILKAKKNLDTSGMSNSKSFLSISDSQITSNINRLGVSLGGDVSKGIMNVKQIEYDRLVLAPQKEQSKDITHDLLVDDASDNDIDIGLDHQAIIHLVGGIADDALGEDGGHWTTGVTLKPFPEKASPTQKRKIEATKN